MSRKYARESAFKLVYEFCIAEKFNALSYDSFKHSDEMTADDALYFDALVKGVIERYGELTASIEANTEGYRLNRIYKIDLSILLTALYEIKYRSDTPVAVVINEAVELAKTYSAEKSFSFVNGILKKFAGARETDVNKSSVAERGAKKAEAE